jgi:hypothetical protein
MTKLEYRDFYRFLVSLGTVLIALALIVPWLFLQESFDASLKVSDILELTPTAQMLIGYRQNTALWFIRNIWWISLLLAVGGLGFLISGIVLWAPKQRLLDRREESEAGKIDLELAKLRLELETMTPAEIAEKGIKKAEEEIQIEERREPPIEPRVQKYFHIEKVVLDKLAACFGERKVLTQQKIRQMSYDAVLLFDDPQSADVIIEIKLLPHPLSPQRFDLMIDQIAFQATTYAEATNRKVSAMPLFVLLQGDLSRHVIERFESRIRDWAKAHGLSIHPMFVAEQDLWDLECDALKARILARASTMPEDA